MLALLGRHLPLKYRTVDVPRKWLNKPNTSAGEKPRKIMNKYQKILTIVALIAFSAIMALSAQGMIGQTPDQVIAGARKDRDTVKIYNASFSNLPEVYVDYKDGSTIRHTFGRKGREIAFSWTAPFISNDDVVKIQRAYRTQWYGIGTEGGVYQWVSKNRLQMMQMMAQRHEKYYDLTIFEMDRSGEIKSAIARNEASTKTAVYPPAQEPFNPNASMPDEGLKPAQVTPQVHFQPIRQPSVTRPPNDCYIVASQIYAGLRTSSYWVKVAAITITVKGTNETIGHTVVFSQLTRQSNIVMSDENGALELATKSHELSDIIAAAAQMSLKGPTMPYVVLSGTKWIDG